MQEEGGIVEDEGTIAKTNTSPLDGGNNSSGGEDEGAVISSQSMHEGFSSATTAALHPENCILKPNTPPIPSSNRQSAIGALGAFFLHSGIPSSCIRHLLLALLLIVIGVLGVKRFPTLYFLSYPLANICIVLGLTIILFALILGILHGLVVFCHARHLFYNWNFIHYTSELESYIATIVTISIILVTLNFSTIQTWADKWVFGSPDLRSWSIYIALGILLATVLLAIKRHYMTGLAVSFNYSNYRDRIQESLFADHILNLLHKSRLTYKVRQKMRSKENHLEHPSIRQSERQQPALEFANIVRSRMGGRPEHSVRSVRDIFRSTASDQAYSSPIIPPSPSPPPPPPPPPAQSPLFTASIAPASPQSRTTPLGFPVISPSLPPTSTTTATAPSPNSPCMAAYLTESEKKRQFNEFYRLASQMISRFSNRADYRAEIANEAKRLAEKLFKYLHQPERDYLLGEDLLPYVEDEMKFRRAITLIKRYVEGTFGNPPTLLLMDDAVNFAFSLGDFQRSIEGILTEVYVTAKSLQSIETALDKVDLFFTFLVILIMTIIVAIIMGDAIKLLLALSTMLSGAAFAFGTSARNMFESMIFLLVIHPFDVGDRVFIPLGTTMTNLATTFATMSGVDALDNLLVVEMHLLSTIFERWDGVRLYVPNYILASKPIFNIRRSGPLIESQRIHIDFSTPINKIEELRNRLSEYLNRESTDFTDFSRLVVDSIENSNRIHLNIVYQHSTNWQDLDMQLTRRTKLLAFIKDSLETLGITYLPPIQRVALVPSSKAELPSENSQVNLLTGSEARRLFQMIHAHHSPV